MYLLSMRNIFEKCSIIDLNCGLLSRPTDPFRGIRPARETEYQIEVA